METSAFDGTRVFIFKTTSIGIFDLYSVDVPTLQTLKKDFRKTYAVVWSP